MKTIVAFLLFCGLQLAAQDMQSCPMHKQHQVVSSNNRGWKNRARAGAGVEKLLGHHASLIASLMGFAASHPGVRWQWKEQFQQFFSSLVIDIRMTLKEEDCLF